MWIGLLKDNVIILSLLSIMLNSGEYTGYVDTHTKHIICIYYLLDKLHLSFNKHCNTFVIAFVENEQNECIAFYATPFFYV